MSPLKVKKLYLSDLWRCEEFWSRYLKFDKLTLKDTRGIASQITQKVRQSQDKSPLSIFHGVMEDFPKVPVHGSWHHHIMAPLLLVALRNNGYRISDEQMEESIFRSRMLYPGGLCGFQGICPVLVGVSIAVSILTKTTPLHDKERSFVLRTLGEATLKFAELGGVRCCKQASYLAMELSIDYLSQIGYQLPREDFAGCCEFHQNNITCAGKNCPYFPRVC